MSEKIIIFDTTLRDGEQSPGASLNVHEKVEIARQLEKLNVDVIEAGFPVSSPVQFEAVKRIAGEIDVMIAALARAKEQDIKKIKALIEKIRPEIIFLPNPLDLHPRHKLLAKLVLNSLTKRNKGVGLFFYEIPWSVFSSNEFNFIVPLSKELMQQKINAIKIHKSQLSRTNFVKLAKALLSLRAGMVPEQKITGYGSKFSLSNWVEVYKYKSF